MRKLLAAVAFALLATPALAQPVCMTYDRFVEAAAKGYDERPIAEYDTEGGRIVILVSQAGTVTVLIVRGENACLAGTGDHFRPAAAPGKPA